MLFFSLVVEWNGVCLDIIHVKLLWETVEFQTLGLWNLDLPFEVTRVQMNGKLAVLVAFSLCSALE